jgi:hypothetical protein
VSADGLSIEVVRHTLKFTREGGVTFVRSLDAHRVKADLSSFAITATTVEGPVILRFEQEQAEQLSRSIRGVYPEKDLAGC